MVFGRDGQKRIHALAEARLVLLPEQIVEEYPHGVHADALRPAQFEIDPFRIERFGLPHFQLVDCGGRDVIGAD